MFGSVKIAAAQTKSDIATIGRNVSIMAIATDANCPTATLKVLVIDRNPAGAEVELPLYEADGATEWSMPIQASRAYLVGWEVFAPLTAFKFVVSAAPTNPTVIKLLVRDA